MNIFDCQIDYAQKTYDYVICEEGIARNMGLWNKCCALLGVKFNGTPEKYHLDNSPASCSFALYRSERTAAGLECHNFGFYGENIDDWVHTARNPFLKRNFIVIYKHEHF